MGTSPSQHRKEIEPAPPTHGAIAEVEARLRSKTIMFFVNGEKHYLPKPGTLIDPELTVLEYLRDEGLTGTKLVCGEGGCGACTVLRTWKDGTGVLRHQTLNACLATICEMDRCHIATVEGLCNKDASVLHPIQEAMSKSHASQCGYCTPGIVMSMFGLWMNKKEPTVHDIEDHFDGNLCRCTGYRPILQAYQPFAKDYEGLKNSEGLLNNQGPLTPNQVGQSGKTRCCGHVIPPTISNDSVTWAEELERRFSTDILSQLPDPVGVYVEGQHLGDRCEWFRPASLRDLLIIRAAKPNVRLQVGNTERRVEKMFKWSHKYPMTLISMSRIPDMLGITWDELGHAMDHSEQNPNQRAANRTQRLAQHVLDSVDRDSVRIGAATPLSEIHAAFETQIAKRGKDPRNQLLSSWCSILKWFAGHAIRNVACLGGNIVTASPISDLNPCHIASGAHLEVASLDTSTGQAKIRVVPMGDLSTPFFMGYRKVNLAPEEVIVALVLPLGRTDGSEFFQAFKQSRRRDDDLAIVNAAMRVRFQSPGGPVDEACFAFGGVGPFTKGCPALANWWRGKLWSYNNFEASLSVLSEDIDIPLGAPGGMVEYRRTLVRSFYLKFWMYVAHASNGEAIPAPFKQRDLGAALSHSTYHYHAPNKKGLQHFARDQETLRQCIGDPDKHQAGDMQVAGHAEYIDDEPCVQKELFMDFVLSTKAHAKIIRVDDADAQKVEGFVDLITYKDIPGENMLGPIAHDEEALASDEVYCVGQIIAAVCATSRYAARVAAKAVRVEYSDLPAIVGLEEAVEKQSFHKLMFQNPGDDFALIHTVREPEFQNDSIDGLFSKLQRDSDVEIVEGEAFMGGQEHFSLETHCTRVIPKENDEYYIYSSTQNPAETQLLCAKALAVPLSKVTVRVKRLGGAFGGKESRCCLMSVPAVIAAQKLRRPVRFQMDRDVDTTTNGKRHAFFAKYKFAVHKGTMKMLAQDVAIYGNAGWSLDLSQPVLQRAMLHITNCCYIPNVRVCGRLAKTNIQSNTAFRGFGGPQGMFMGDIIFEHAAKKLGVSREELVGRNLFASGDETHFCWNLGDQVPLQRMWDQLMKQSDFAHRREDIEAFNAANRYKKRGISSAAVMFGISFTATQLNQGGALIHVQKDGTVLLTHGGIEMGQGLHTKMARVAATTLDIPISAVYIAETATDKVANTTATAASSGSDINGGAVLLACQELNKRLAPFVEKHKPSGALTDAQRVEVMAKVANDAFFNRVNLTAQAYHRTPIKGVNWKNQGVNEMVGAEPFWYYAHGVAASEVEIDCLTGDMAILRTDIVHDVGKSLNAALDIGQIEGAFMQGMGLFTIEEIAYNKEGHLMTKGPGMYKIPGFGDIPQDFRVRLLENSEGPAVMGSKAVGEPPLYLASSVFFALKEAIHAARKDFVAEQSLSPQEALTLTQHVHLDSPMTCEKIRMACLDTLNPEGVASQWHARA